MMVDGKNLRWKGNTNSMNCYIKDAITTEEYKQLNTMLAELLCEEMDLEP